ncbi:MAG: ATP-binding protein [bacterium]
MDKEKIKALLIEHKERFISHTNLYPRDILKTLDTYLQQREIIFLTGIRRCGKSSLMKLICTDLISKSGLPKSDILYLNFEDERLIDFTVKDFDLLYETFIEIENPQGKKYFFLDEIQNITGWERWVNRLYEFEEIKFIITGSNAKMLSSEISSSLTGRSRHVVIWPFSFNEYLRLKEIVVDKKSLYLVEKKGEIKRLFSDYLSLGGFPEILKNNDPTLLEQYFNDIIYRDLIVRYRIRNIKEIKELILFLASNPATIHSYKSLANLIGTKNISTIKNYLEELNNIFLFFSVNLFDYSIRRQIYNPSKIFCIDTALSNSISFKFLETIGHLYENLVYIELKRRGLDIFYWKSKKGREVDFVIKKGLEITEAIQVSRSLLDKRTKEREIRALLEAKEELKPSRLTIITEDEEGEETVDDTKIKVLPLWKWLIY